MKESLRKRILATKGVEFTFMFNEDNGTDLDGLRTDAYVAQADPDIGITIMGAFPDSIDCSEYGVEDDQDIVLKCCNCYGDPDDPDYLGIVEQYVDMIESGGTKRVICESNGGGDATHMANSCPFS